MKQTIKSESEIRKCLEKFLANHPLMTAFMVSSAFAIIIVLVTRSFFTYNLEFGKNLVIEAHGMVFDLFVIGWFVLLLNKLGERRLTIRRYREEIEDYLGWASDEAIHRIASNIRRLNRENESDITLHGAYLVKAKLRGVNLAGADLEQADLREADLSQVNMQGANLQRANLCGANLKGANLKGANLQGVNLHETELDQTTRNHMPHAALRMWQIVNGTLRQNDLSNLSSGINFDMEMT